MAWHRCSSPRCPGYPFADDKLKHPKSTCGIETEPNDSVKLIREREAAAQAGPMTREPVAAATIAAPPCPDCARWATRVKLLEDRLTRITATAVGADDAKS